MDPVSIVILSAVIVAAVVAVIFIVRSKGRCSSCNGNCEFCKYKDKRDK